MDELFLRQTAAGNEHYHVGILGSTFSLSDAAGALIVTYSYEPFGRTTATGISSNPFQYTGRENDAPGLYYYRARYLSTRSQRFIKQDPIGLRGGINFYAIVDNNPLRFRDPFGLDKSQCNGILCTGVDAGVGVTLGMDRTTCSIAEGCSTWTVFPPSFGISLIDISVNKPPDSADPTNVFIGLGHDLEVGTYLVPNPKFSPYQPSHVTQGFSFSFGPSVGLPFGIGAPRK